MHKNTLLLLGILLCSTSVWGADFCTTSYPSCDALTPGHFGPCTVNHSMTLNPALSYAGISPNICADNVTLDCAGELIKSIDMVLRSGITVQNCLGFGSGSGVKMGANTNITFTNNTYLDDYTDFGYATASNVTIQNNTNVSFSLIGSGNKFLGNKDSFVNFMGNDNVANGNTNATLWLDGSNNTINGNTDSHIGISSYPLTTYATSNTITNNTNSKQMNVSRTTNSLISGNTTTGGVAGIHLFDSNTNIISNNHLVKSTYTGIGLSKSGNNLIVNNFICNSGTIDLYSDPPGNNAHDNTCTTTQGVHDTNFTNCSIYCPGTEPVIECKDKNGKLIVPLTEVTDPEAILFNDAAHDEQSIVDKTKLTTEMKAALSKFTAFIDGNSGKITVTSAFRPTAYQSHLYELKTKYLELLKVKGIKYVKSKGGYPTILVDESVPEADACGPIATMVNEEISTHELLKGDNQNAPAVSAPGKSYHEYGLAFDATIKGLPKNPKNLLDKIAKAAGLWRPCKEKDAVHFQLLNTKNCTYKP